MSDYLKKIIGEREVSAEKWNSFLKEAHQQAPSMTPHALSDKALKNLEQDFIDLLSNHQDSSGNVFLKFPMTKFSVQKL